MKNKELTKAIIIATYTLGTGAVLAYTTFPAVLKRFKFKYHLDDKKVEDIDEAEVLPEEEN